MTDGIVGKKILVGLTYLDKEGEVNEQKQLHGKIKEVSDTTLVFSQPNNLGDFSIPYDGELESTDEENIFTLRSHGEEVTGINYLATFTIHKSPDE